MSRPISARHQLEVRPRQPSDGDFLAGCDWVAVDGLQRKFGGKTQQEALSLAIEYLSGRPLIQRQLQFDL